MLLNLGKCYNKTETPDVSLEWNIAFRRMHYFLGEKMAFYDESLFAHPNGLKSKRFVTFQAPVYIDNTTFYMENKCGMTHGSMDLAWNLAGLQKNVWRL